MAADAKVRKSTKRNPPLLSDSNPSRRTVTRGGSGVPAGGIPPLRSDSNDSRCTITQHVRMVRGEWLRLCALRERAGAHGYGARWGEFLTWLCGLGEAELRAREVRTGPPSVRGHRQSVPGGRAATPR